MTDRAETRAEEASEAEFDVMARWTADAVAELGDDHAEAAACRGSGSPAALDWLAQRLGLAPGVLLVDCGGGTGGAAAYAASRTGATPVLVEPMIGACRAARRMFAHPVAVADGVRLPLASQAASAAWCLGVLSTTTEEGALLAEVHRVLRPGGALGLLVLLRVADELPDAPADNDFCTPAGLDRSLATAGFEVVEAMDLDDLDPPPPEWDERADRVEAVVERDHGDDPRWREAQGNAEAVGRLMQEGRVIGRLLHARGT